MACFFSVRTAETLAALLRQNGLEACCASLIAIGISEAVTDAVKPLPWRKDQAAAAPNERAMIERLQALIPATEAGAEAMTETSAPIPNLPALPPVRGRQTKFVCLAAALLIFAIFFGMLAFCPWVARLYIGPAHDIVDIKARLATLEGRVQTLEERPAGHEAPAPAPVAAALVPVAPVASSTDVTRMQGDLASLSTSLSALQTEVKQIEGASAQAAETTRALLAEALAFMQLRDAAEAGRGFSQELAAMRAAAASDAAVQEPLARLAPYAASGAPTIVALGSELTDLESGAAAAVEGAHAMSGGNGCWPNSRGLFPSAACMAMKRAISHRLKPRWRKTAPPPHSMC